MTTLVTGGRGFIGRRLVSALGPDTRVIDINDGKEGILDMDLLIREFQSVGTVFHLGSCSGNLFFEGNNTRGIVTNCVGTWNVLEAARIARVKRVVFASTQTAYAGVPAPHLEDGPVSPDTNLYTATKIFGEYLCRMYWKRHGLETVILRFASVYGIGEETKGHVCNPAVQFIESMLRGNQPIVFGDGSQTRDLVYVDDVVSALIHAATRVPPGELYNVALGTPITFNEVVSIINEELKTNLSPLYKPYVPAGLQVNYIAEQWASIEKLQATGWRPRVDVREGIKRTIEYTRTRPGFK